MRGKVRLTARLVMGLAAALAAASLFLCVAAATLTSYAPAAQASMVSYAPQEVELVRLINEYRVSLGLQPLMVSDRCSLAAERHSSDMGKYGFFSHTTQASDWFPVGADGGVRLARCGYGYLVAWGENIAAGQSMASTVFRDWKTSTLGHNEIMTSPVYKVVGVGMVYTPGSPYGYYWTADFGAYVDDTARWLEGTVPPDATTTTTTAPTPTTTGPTPSTTTTTLPTTTTTTTPSQDFWDVPLSHLFYGPIRALAQAGVVSGYPDGSFRPDAPLTRAQCAKIMVLALGRHTPEIENADHPTFSDVPYTGSAYPFDYVEEAAALGIVEGRGDGTFAPDAKITRLQLVLMLVRAGGAELSALPAGYSCPFSDVPAYAREAVATAYFNHLVSGKTATKFDPYSPATRGQVAKMVQGLRVILAD